MKTSLDGLLHVGHDNRNDTTDVLRIVGCGGQRIISGVIPIAPSKNGILPALASAVIFQGDFTLHNVPTVSDVASLLRILKSLGITCHRANGDVSVVVPKQVGSDLPADEVAETRGVVAFSGPCLARTGRCCIPKAGPGGCSIGKRPIDFYLDFYRALGATVHINDRHIVCEAPQGLSGTTFAFPRKSVVGTMTAAMTALLASGTTVIQNCALEPEIENLLQFFVDNGGTIRGIGTETLSIDGTGGVPLVASVPFTNIPDRIETGSWLLLAASVGRDITITNCQPQHVRVVVELLRTLGVPGITETAESIHLCIPEDFSFTNKKSLSITTKEYPGFPTDLQTPTLVFLTQVNDTHTVQETIFEERMAAQITELRKFGFDIEYLDNSRARTHPLNGKHPKGTSVVAVDIRSGFACVLAAILADGETVLYNKQVIDRGYENIAGRLQKLGITAS